MPTTSIYWYSGAMSEAVRRHYELYPYPRYPLLASVRAVDTYASNLTALWTRFNGELPPPQAGRILIAGCGSFAPYPFAVANPGADITALDLSRSSLRRARLHCLLHGVTGIDFRAGDLCDPAATRGEFGLIDSYGVLHHLEDPLVGLRSLAGRLCEGGILRVMVYSRYTRSEEEAVRHALRLLRVQDPGEVRRLLGRARSGSRLKNFVEACHEVSDKAGLADALLHPCVHTYRIDSFMELVRQSGLEPLLFAHSGALFHPDEEVERIRRMERERRSPGNFVLYLGRGTKGRCREEEGSFFCLNPCLKRAISQLHPGSVFPAARLGHPPPPLDRGARKFLRRFLKPVPGVDLSPAASAAARAYCDPLFLLHYRGERQQ